MFGRIRSSRNAKNRPKKCGEIYGDNLNSVADVACGLDKDGIQLSGKVTLIADDDTMMATMEPRGCPVMGVDMDGMAVDQKLIRKLGFGKNERFEASASGDKYILDTGKVRYTLPTGEPRPAPREPEVVRSIESNGTGTEFDTSIIQDLYKEARSDPSMRKHIGKEHNQDYVAVILVSDSHGMSAQLGDGGGCYMDIMSAPRIITTRGTEEEHVAIYSLDRLRNIVKANPTGRLSFDTDYPLLFTWDDPTYKGRMVLMPIIYDEEDSAKIHSDALANHRAAFGAVSANRRPSSGRRR